MRTFRIFLETGVTRHPLISGIGKGIMKILITGNMGYIGPSVMNRLRASYPGATLVGFDIGYFGSCITGVDVFPECKVDIQYFADILNGMDDRTGRKKIWNHWPPNNQIMRHQRNEKR
jgi:hypothetical protein